MYDKFTPMGPSIKYSRYFGPILTPPVTHCHTSSDPPKVCHTSRNPTILVVHTYAFTWRFTSLIVRGDFVCKDLFGVVLSVPSSVRIHPLQQKAKYHIKF